jgi:hypothetical protein
MEGDKRYNNNEINLMFDKIDKTLQGQDHTLSRIESQTTKTNGRVNKLEKWMLIVGCVTATLLVTSGSKFAGFLMDLFT